MKDFELPFAIDKVTKKPSVTLLFAYVAFILATLASGYLLYRDVIAGTVSCLTLFFGTLVFYRLRRLDKVKFDLDDKSFELESSGEEEKK